MQAPTFQKWKYSVRWFAPPQYAWQRQMQNNNSFARWVPLFSVALHTELLRQPIKCITPVNVLTRHVLLQKWDILRWSQAQHLFDELIWPCSQIFMRDFVLAWLTDLAFTSCMIVLILRWANNQGVFLPPSPLPNMLRSGCIAVKTGRPHLRFINRHCNIIIAILIAKLQVSFSETHPRRSRYNLFTVAPDLQNFQHTTVQLFKSFNGVCALLLVLHIPCKKKRVKLTKHVECEWVGASQLWTVEKQILFSVNVKKSLAF